MQVPQLRSSSRLSALQARWRRFWISLSLTVAVFAIAISEMIPGDPLAVLLSPSCDELEFGLGHRQRPAVAQGRGLRRAVLLGETDDGTRTQSDE